MPRDLFECTAADLATESVEHLSHDALSSEAASWLDDNGYDAAPVYRDGDPVGFVRRDDLSVDSDGDALDAHLTPLTIDHVISGDAAFTDVLAALVEASVYFLGGRNRVSGVLTRADLNTASARIYLFDRITALEQRLRELVLDAAPDWKDAPVSPDVIDDIEARHADAEAANVALNEIHYAPFSTLETVVTSVEPCWRACGFATAGGASAALHEVTRLRNDVAHANLLVENTDSNAFLSDGRTTADLRDVLETIEDVLAALREAGYREAGGREP